MVVAVGLSGVVFVLKQREKEVVGVGRGLLSAVVRYMSHLFSVKKG